MGKFGDVVGDSACSSCPVGRYSESLGAISADSCLACEAGKASMGGGSSLCAACEAGASADQSRCLCKVGHGVNVAGTATTAPSRQVPDGTSVRILDGDGNRPSFDSWGLVTGRIEVLPRGETEWGTIGGNPGYSGDHNFAMVATMTKS